MQKHTLEEFAKHRETVLRSLRDAALAFEFVGRTPRASDMTNACEKLVNDRFQIVVFGPMKVGKSTLVNALLGVDLLPSEQGTSCTGVPTHVRDGQSVMWVAMQGQEELLIGTQNEARKVIETGQYRDRPIDSVVLKVVGSKLCHEGVELIDTPGTTEWGALGEVRAASAINVATHADCVLAVWSADAIGVKADADMLASLLQGNVSPECIFVVINRAQMPMVPETKARFLTKARTVLEPARVADSHVYFTDAKLGLASRVVREDANSRLSGIPDLESGLGRFLSTQRGSAKLFNSLHVAEMATEEAIDRIDDWERDAFGKLIGGAEDASTRADAACAECKASVDSTKTNAQELTLALQKQLHASLKSLHVSLKAGVVDVVNEQSVDWADAVFNSNETRDRLSRVAMDWIKSQVETWRQRELSSAISSFAVNLEGHAVNTVRILARLARQTEEDCARWGIMDSEIKALLSAREQRSSDLRQSLKDAELEIKDLRVTLEASSGVVTAAVVGGMIGGWLAIVLAIAFWPLVVVGAAILGIFGAASAASRLKAKVAAGMQQLIDERFAEMQSSIEQGIAKAVDEKSKSILNKLDDALTELERMAQHLRISLSVRREDHRQVIAKCEDHRSRLFANTTELDALRRELHKRDIVEAVASRVGTRNAGTPTVEVKDDHNNARAEPPPKVHRFTISELKARLDEDLWLRVVDACKWMAERGRRQEDCEHQLATFLLDMPPFTTGAAQVPAYRGVAAYSTFLGQQQMPDEESATATVGTWLQDPKPRSEMMALYARINSKRHRIEEVGGMSDEAKLENAIRNFLAAYTRSLNPAERKPASNPSA